MTSFRTALLASCSLAAASLGAATAEAQTQCGASYTIEPGDTLYKISQACRISLSRIYDLNPGIDPHSLAVGERITLASGTSGGDSDDRNASRGDDSYTVEPGDTAFAIAQTLGLSVVELMNQNPGLNPLSMAVGEVLDLPTGDRNAGIRIQPQEGPPRAEVEIRAYNLRPDDIVTIGAGRTASEWRAITSARVNENGVMESTVRVPARFGAGEDIVFVVDTDRGQTLKSLEFEVTAEGGSEPQTVELEGRVQEGVECPVLRTPDGDRYALTSSEVTITPGEYVEIEGRRAGISYCMQGRDTISVSSIREVSPPRRDDGRDRAGRLTAADLRGSWKYDDGVCARPNFDITRYAGGYLAVETSLNGSARTGDVRTGRNAAFLFDQPYTEISISNRGEGRINVRAPEGRDVTLGGRDISGDGALFVRC